MRSSMRSSGAVIRGLCFWLLASLARASGPLDLWVLWTDRDGADFFFTSSTCATVTLPDVSIAGNEPAPPPANGGISDMLFFADTFEFVFLEGGKLVRAWMDKTGRSELGFLPGDAPGPVWNATGTGPNLGEEGALAWTQNAGMAMVFFASSLTNKLWVSNLSSVPPRDSSHLGPWMEVLEGSQATSARPQVPVLFARDGMVLWSDTLVLRTWSAKDALEAAALGGQSAGSAVAQLGSGADAWGELLVAESTHDGGMLWIRQVGSNPAQLEHVLQLESLIDGPNANVATGNVRWLHGFSEGDVPSAIAVPPTPGPGLPYLGNLTELFQQVYFSILGPTLQARLDHLDLGTGVVTTVAFAGGIERRGADPARPGALSIYPMPEVCVNVGCLYLENAFSHCEKCTTTICDTCFLDTQDWLIKEWYPQHTIWTSCVWLWPIDQAAWVVRTQVQQAKEDGLLPDDFIVKELPPTPGEATPPGTTARPLTTTARPTTTATSLTVTTHTLTTTSSSATATTTNPCAAVPPLVGDALDACRAEIASWCQAEPGLPDMTLAPLDLRAQCAGFAWSAEALCSEPAAVADGGTLIGDGGTFDGCTSCTELWGLALLAGLGLLLTMMVCITWCLTTSRRLQAQRADQDLRAAAQVRRAGSADEGLNPDMGVSAPNSTVPDWPASNRQPGWKSCTRRLRCPCCRNRSSKAASQVKPSPPRPSSPDFEEEDRPESSMSSTGAVPGADNIQASVPVEQILKGTWQPELSSAGAAAAAGRLSEAMRKFMSPDSDEAKRWRFLDDVEDILRTLGSALPPGVRNAAWSWHSRQSARLHRSHALTAALDEARSMADDFREDLSERLVSGVRRLEASALLEAVGGAGKEGQGDERAPLSAAERESLAKASKVEDALEQLKTRMESLSGSSTGVKGDLLHAGHLLDCQQALQRLLEEQEAAERLLREQAGDGDALLSGGTAQQMWQQLGEDIRTLQEALATKLDGSGILAGGASSISAASNLEWDQSSRRDGNDPKTQHRKAASKSWLQGLKQAAARAAGFAAALRTARMQKDKKQLDEMQSLLQKELQSFAEAQRVAQDGGRWTGQQSDAWRQLNGVWSELQEELKACDNMAATDDQEKERGQSGSSPTLTRGNSKLLNYAATRRANLMLPPKRSDTRSLDAEELAAAGPAAQASSAQLSTLRAELAKLRHKVQQLPSGMGHGKATVQDPESPEQRLLMAGLMELHRQDLQRLIEAAEVEQRGLASLADSAGGDGVQETLGNLWQQLKGELQDLQSQLDPSSETMNVQSSPSSATGGLSAGIGASLLTPSKSGKLARLPSKLKRPTLPRAVTEAASKYLRASEALAKLRWQRSQLADSHPLLRLGQAAAEEEALAGLEGDVLRALEMNEGWEGNDQEWSALQGLWRQLRRDVAEARTASIHSASTALEEAAGDSTEGGRYGSRSAWLASEEEEDAEGSHHDSRHGERNLPTASAWSEDGKALGFGGIGGSGLERAAQRLAKLEEELELQQEELTRYHQMEHGDGGVLLVGHALLHQRQLEKLAAQRDICRKELQELLEAASREGWSDEQMAACEKLAARCQDLDHALRSCTEKSALLREDAQKVLTSKGGSSAFGAAIAAAFNASDAELQAALSEALRRMANFEHDLEQQRAALKRRRKKEPGAMADDESLTALVVEKGQALAQCQDFAEKMPAQAWNLIVSTWHGKLTDGLERLAMRADVEGAEDSSEDEDARQRRRLLVDRGEAVDPSAALQEARRRLAQLAEEAERQRLGLKRRQRRARGDEGSDEEGSLEEQTLRSSAISAWGDAEDAAGKSEEIELLRRAQRGMGRSAWTDDPAASADDFYPSSLAEAAQRLAGFEEQLRAQQKSLRRLEQQKRSGEADDVLLAEHALLNQGALEALAAERGRCRRQLQKLLQVAEAEGWSQDQRAAYDQLVAQCQRLEESFKSLDQTAEMLQQGTEEAVAAPGATSAIEALKAALAGKVDDPELRAALDAALKRLASFDSDLEQQRAALKRRRVRSSSSTSGAHDATELSALVELIDGRSEALSQCEDFAHKLPSELWQLILSLWRGKLTDDLQHLLEKILGPDVAQEDASEGGGDGRRSRLRFNRDEPVDTDAALREARRRLMQLAEEEARQRARLAQRRRKQKAGAEHEEEASPGSADDPASRSRRLKVKPAFDNEEARRAVAEAARRLANFEDQLELQRCGLQRRRVQKQSGEVDDVTLLGYALLHHGELEALAAERKGCLSDCDRLLQVAGREGWSSEDVGACEQLGARCRDLDDSFRSCVQTAAQLKQDASKAAPLRFEDSERQAALEEALRRVARFDHDVEAQREALRRRRRKGATGGEAAVDAVLASLLEQRREARLQCEELGRDSPSEAWSLIDSLWSGKLTERLEQLTVHVSVRVQEPSSEDSQRSSRQPGPGGSVDTSAEMAEARRRLAQLSEDAERQRLGLRARRRRGKAEEAVKEELEQIAASGAEFGALAVEHCEGLQDQEKSLSEVMQKDSEAMDEIEAWRQLVGLEELQAAASKMSKRLQDEATGKTVADLTGLSPSRLKRQGTKGDFSTDTSAAKQQCEEMKARLQELREEEEERQRLLLQRRQRRKRQEPPEDAEEAALEAEARSRELLLKAHECLVDGGQKTEDVQDLRQKLRELRAEGYEEAVSKEEPAEAVQPPEPEPAKPPKEPPKEELLAALAASEQRTDWVSSMAANLLSQLEVVFEDRDQQGVHLGNAVAAVVDRWRGQLPKETAAELEEAASGSMECLNRLGDAAQQAMAQQVVTGEERDFLLGSWRSQLVGAAQETEKQSSNEQEEIRARASARRRERQEKRAKATSETQKRQSRWRAVKEASKSFKTPAAAEVRRYRSEGESLVRSFYRNAEEEEEQQARRMLRRLEERRSRAQSRSRPSTAAPSAETSPLDSPLRRGLARSNSNWAWSPSEPALTTQDSTAPSAEKSPLDSPLRRGLARSNSNWAWSPQRRLEPTVTTQDMMMMSFASEWMPQ
ncbi:unnamed protein product [Symbiodinium sp. CCMP2592]|nr:unnamed protein product [Symbiodinium sp. CCMP2592]